MSDDLHTEQSSGQPMAVSTLSLLITRLKRFTPFGDEERPPVFNFILNYRQFVDVLERIDGRIGWTDAKREIALKVKSMVVNYRKYGTPVGKEALHTLITGDPGVGKTMFGTDLAELWAVAGCLKSEPKQNVVSTINPQLLSAHQQLLIKETQMKSLQSTHQQARINASLACTQLNRLRRKIRGHGQDFQELKRLIQEISTSGGLTPVRLNPGVKILPILVPTIQSRPIEFGSIALPSLSSLDPMALPVISKVESEEKVTFKFGLFTRGDFVAKFQGHSTDRVRNIIKEYEGGVIMIDEAYDLVTTENDDFGREVLTEIINYMTRFPDKIIFIFSGYKKQMEKTIMALQPGLSRRFKWKFDISKYSSKEIYDIFASQLKNVDLTVQASEVEKIQKLIDSHSKTGYFQYYGGDTERLANYVRDMMQENLFEPALNSSLTPDEYRSLFLEVTEDVFQAAFERYKQNYTLDTEDSPPEGMYI